MNKMLEITQKKRDVCLGLGLGGNCENWNFY